MIGRAAKHPALRVLRGLAALSLTVLGWAIWYGHVYGLPPAVSRQLLRLAAGDDYCAEASLVRLRGVDRIEIERLNVYARGRIGPPMLESRLATIRGGPWSAMLGRGVLEEISLGEAVWRPAAPRTQYRHSTLARGKRPGPFRFASDSLSCKNVTLQRLACTIDLSGGRLRVSDIRCRLGRGGGAESDCAGEFAVDVAARSVCGRFETSFDPREAVPLLRELRQSFCVDLIGLFGFAAGSPPRSEFAFESRLGAPATLAVTAKVRFENGSYRGVGVLRADAAVVIDAGADHLRVTLDPLVVARPEGVAQVKIAVEPYNDLVRFDGTSTLEPHALTRLIGIFTNGWLDAVAVTGACRVTSAGTVDLVGDLRQSIVTTVEGRQMAVGRLAAENVSFTVETRGPTNTVRNVKGRMYGGSFEGEGVVVTPSGPAASNGQFLARGALTGADFKTVHAALRSDPQAPDLKGDMDLRLDVGGPLDAARWRDLRGTGRISIRKGRVFMLPIFGGLTAFLSKVVPGVDFVLGQNDFSADFELRDRSILSEHVAVEGGVFSLQGKGVCGFDGNLNYAVQVKLMREHPLFAKLIRLITWPLSKLFEFRLTGTVAKPEWYPINFSRELLENLGLKGERPPTPPADGADHADAK